VAVFGPSTDSVYYFAVPFHGHGDVVDASEKYAEFSDSGGK